MTSLFGEDFSSNEKSIYLTYENIPKKLFVNQIFPVTIRIIIAEDEYSNLTFNLENGKNILPMAYDIPIESKEIYLYKTFYFKALSTDIELPDIVANLILNEYAPVKKEILKGKKIKAIKLNPPKDFSNILAKDLKVVDFQATQYDNEQNLIILNIESNLSNLEDFHLSFVNSEKIEEINTTFPISKMTYIAIIPNYIKNFHFSYFDITKNRFKKFSKNIEIKDETVSTQTDIKPEELSYKNLKIIILLSFSAIFLIIAIFKKSLLFLLIAFIFGGYGAYLSIPLEEICIKQGSSVKILPTKNSTVFYKTKYNLKTKKLGKVDGFIKIELPNKKVGWVKDENICKD